MSVTSTGKHVLLQGAGWILVIVGLAALVYSYVHFRDPDDEENPA